MSGADTLTPSGDKALQLPPRPYPGLRPFDPPEWPIFFGRERVVDELLDRVVSQRLVFVHGDSGCGKSSLVRAGLFAQLEQGRAGSGWRTGLAMPRRAPLWNVAEALAGLGGAASGDDAAVLPWRRALNFGRDAPAELQRLYAPTLAARGPACLLIDQFEELFQHAQRDGPAEARLLTEALMAWQAQSPEGLYLVTTMRSEYLGACARFGRFAETVNATQYLLPPMEHADLLRAVREPARLYGGEVTRDLAERLIADAGGAQDQLPLMQHALMRLQERHAPLAGQPGAASWRLELQHFPPEGGCAGLLSDHADEVQASALQAAGAAAGARVVEDLLRALTDTNADGLPIRRPMRLGELAGVTGVPQAGLEKVIDVFRADGVNFLTPPHSRPLKAETLIDVGHEALIRCWKALADPHDGWLMREVRNGLVWRSLLVQCDTFERLQRGSPPADAGGGTDDPVPASGQGVLDPQTTTERQRWMQRRNARWAQRHGGGWERVQALLAASAAARDDETQRLQAQRDNQTRAKRLKWGLMAMGALVMVGSMLIWKMKAEIDESRVQFASVEATRESLAKRSAELSDERKRSDELQAQVRQAQAELERVKAELLQAANRYGASDSAINQRLTKTAQEIGTQAIRLESAGSYAAAPNVAPKPNPSGAGPLPARVYVHIADESQRAAALQLGKALGEQRLGGTRVVVPGVEFVKATPRRAELRCFAEAECADEAPQLRALVARLLADPPELGLENLSSRYGSSSSLRARHYELWFPPGPLRLR